MEERIVLYCPVCSFLIGTKYSYETKSFICTSEGCSKTEHFYKPGKSDTPYKSVPWAEYWRDKSKCGKPCCDPK